MVRSFSKYRSLFNDAQDMIHIMDENGRMIDANPIELETMGYTREEYLGKPLFEIVHPDCLVTTKKAFESILSGEKAKVYETALLNKLGKKVDIEVTAVPQMEGRKVIAAMEIMRNITERKQAEEEIKESREQLRNFSVHLQSTREGDRASIAREIHDEFGQLLTALKIDMSWLDKRLPKDQGPLLNKAKSMIQLIDKGVESVQRICSELRPSLLDDLGISSAIEWQIQEFTDRTGIKHRITVTPGDIALTPDLSTATFRIFQEALTNIMRYADATMVNVSFTQKDDELTLTVADNGKGIIQNQISDSKSFGLLGMRERARYYNGDVEITGVRGKGSTVKVSIPFLDSPIHNIPIS